LAFVFIFRQKIEKRKRNNISKIIQDQGKFFFYYLNQKFITNSGAELSAALSFGINMLFALFAISDTEANADAIMLEAEFVVVVVVVCVKGGDSEEEGERKSFGEEDKFCIKFIFYIFLSLSKLFINRKRKQM